MQIIFLDTQRLVFDLVFQHPIHYIRCAGLPSPAHARRIAKSAGAIRDLLKLGFSTVSMGSYKKHQEQNFLGNSPFDGWTSFFRENDACEKA